MSLNMNSFPMYDSADEHDACGTGFVAAINGKPQRGIVEKGIAALKAVYHRGAVHADGKTGDGAGIMTQIPLSFFQNEIIRLGKQHSSSQPLAIGMMFLPRRDFEAQEACRVIVETEVMAMGYQLYGWRQVPVNPEVIGHEANETRPEIAQLLIKCPATSQLQADGFSNHELIEADLYLIRRNIEKAVNQRGIKNFYICSLSAQKIIYKGLFLAEQLDEFYPDLRSKDFISPYVVFHQRFSTNTAPIWPLAQPFRTLAHNGEINTVRGNSNWMRTHEASMASPLFGDKIENLKPVIPDGGSDTSALDAVVELLIRSGRPAPMAKLIMVPPAWSKNPNIPPHHRALFNYCNCIMAPWDGPAALIIADGPWVMAGLDRNGLRPLRYQITDDGLLCAGSETGMVPIDPNTIIEAGRLGPGEMIGVNFEESKLYRDTEIKDLLAARQNYVEWIGSIKRFRDLPSHNVQTIPYHHDELLRRQLAAGWTREDLDLLLSPMVKDAKEGVGSMGDDTPQAVLSKHYRGLHHFFRQRFSQVTNPPIDPFREAKVMSLKTRIGNKENILSETSRQTNLVELEDPVLLNEEFITVQNYLSADVEIINATFDITSTMRKGIDDLIEHLDAAYASGKRHFVVTDQSANGDKAPLPMILAVAALNTHAVRRGIRKQLTLMVRCGECFDVHHFAVLIGVGATVVNAYLAEATITERHKQAVYGKISLETALQNYKKAVGDGLLKIMSKMGISVISSYRGGTIFETIGLSRSLVATYFPGLTSRISGIGLRGIEDRVLKRHQHAWYDDKITSLPIGGYYAYRAEGEHHNWEATLIHLLQEATTSGRYQLYKQYVDKMKKLPPTNLRDLLDFRSDRAPIAVEEVESVSSIRKRFIAPAMSLGALSPEAHEILAIAMNRIGAYSNSGEGGEGAERYHHRPNGDNPNSRIKQVASGRFGVTADYLNHCDEIQIKIAQGAKPGEGGQLPAFKVTAEIARLRHSTAGVSLISPPPHHDIYSIEDLTQLIYDLKQINPNAIVSVKLVSQSGVGTIASGVAKAHADKILISGHTGGTGAAPFSSIKHAGTPWEMGLAETNQVLTLNRMRHRVVLQTDGGLKTGRDIVVAAMLGAEEYGLGTISLVAMGCLLVRQCHSNTCPVGICTQDEKLRAKFSGSVEKVINLVTFIAEEVREILAELGYRTLSEVIGRPELLRQTSGGSLDLDTLDLGPLLVRPDALPLEDGSPYPRISTIRRNEVGETLDHQVLDDVRKALESREKIQINYSIRNTQRSIGARLSSMICRRFKPSELGEDHVSLQLRGSAGQSLGAFAVQGLKIEVFGDANDYVGKGLSGGLLVLRPRPSSKLVTYKNTIIGNTCLYGATSGRLFAAGQAGERFAVRNSGANTVVEGAGTNACEYMTGGNVVILGGVGYNFGAGMTGGMAFVYDKNGDFETKINSDNVHHLRVDNPHWQDVLKGLIKQHQFYTSSEYALAILENWQHELQYFWQICPRETMSQLELREPISAMG